MRIAHWILSIFLVISICSCVAVLSAFGGGHVRAPTAEETSMQRRNRKLLLLAVVCVVFVVIYVAKTSASQ